MESLIVKNSISKNLLKKSCSFSIINNLNKNAFRQYTIQNKSNLVTSNQISLLNSSIPCVPSISLNNSLISYFNESTSLQNSYKYYSTESSKPTEEKEKKEKEEKDKKVVEEEEEEEEEEDDEIKNITDMKIKISDSAVEHLNEINENSTQYLRIVVEAGGCHGFQYLLDLTQNIDPDDDIIFEKNGAKVVIDTMSLPYIDGATLNYKDDLMGSTFEIIDNPNATESCGCGGSFSV